MRKLFLHIHLYAGVFSAVALLVFGISSLDFNHHFAWLAPQTTEEAWEDVHLKIPPIEDNQTLAQALRDSLQLMGWTPWWEFQRDSTSFHFKITHFGRDYEVSAFPGQEKLRVVEIHKGLGTVLKGLHFLGESIPNASWAVNTWQYYQSFSVFYLIVAIITGVYLWTKKKSERLIGLFLLFGFTGISLLLMLYVWLVG